MIISHTRKFIFLKSWKTAGTSLETVLSNFCGENDIVTPLNDFSYNRDKSGRYVHKGMNAESYKDTGQHVDVVTMRDRNPTEVWDTYYKFSITRNPWDKTVSDFFWENRNDPSTNPRKRFYHYLGVSFDEFKEVRKHFSEYVRKSAEQRTNDRYYVLDDELCVDYVIRYEQLKEGFDHVCGVLGIETDFIPHLKTGIRKGRQHYSQYYDDETRDLVAKFNKNDICLFGYRFGE